MINTVLFVVAAYLVGSISFAVVMSKLFGLADPRTYGSKNPGATNVMRSGNKSAAILTLLGDAVKGWLMVWLAQTFGAEYGVQNGGVALVALAVFCGHLWPLYTKFAGGKGVATALGVLLGISPWLGLAVLGAWIVIAYAFRYSSLAALMAAVFAPMFYILLFGVDAKFLAVLIMSALLVMRHSQNITKLMKGKESKIGSGKPRGQ